uniref:Uncharacterized protein n=1 Tax=Cucumis sativus TaxID=3659 RepID=A0A0A0L207_CUCSA
MSDNRKQRSLPDYNGRGWHESRKLVMEFGGQKKSYMDPQASIGVLAICIISIS